jgi:hypothetical protein
MHGQYQYIKVLSNPLNEYEYIWTILIYTCVNNRYGRGLILAITTPNSLKVKDKGIYYVHSEHTPEVKYRLNSENGTCTCNDFVRRGEVCKHFYKIVMERAFG